MVILLIDRDVNNFVLVLPCAKIDGFMPLNHLTLKILQFFKTEPTHTTLTFIPKSKSKHVNQNIFWILKSIITRNGHWKSIIILRKRKWS